jgi:hypothetical protein
LQQWDWHWFAIQRDLCNPLHAGNLPTAHDRMTTFYRTPKEHVWPKHHIWLAAAAAATKTPDHQPMMPMYPVHI